VRLEKDIEFFQFCVPY